MEPERSGGASDAVSHRRTRRRRLQVGRRPPRFRRILPGRTRRRQAAARPSNRTRLEIGTVRPFGPGVADDVRIHLEVAFPQAQRHAAEEDRRAADAGYRAERVAVAAGQHAVRGVGTVAGVSTKNPSAPRFCGPRGTQSPRSIIRTFLPAITDGQAAMTPPKLLPITMRSCRSPSYLSRAAVWAAAACWRAPAWRRAPAKEAGRVDIRSSRC